MWLGIICTCLPILYTFYRTQFARKRLPNQQSALAGVRDPNSGPIAAHIAEDSGYHTGNITIITMDRMDVERLDGRAGDEHSVGPATSTKSLLVTTEERIL